MVPGELEFFGTGEEKEFTVTLDVVDAGARPDGAAGVLNAVVVGAAALASLGALLALIAGVGRTSLAMARARDLPMVLSRISTRFGVPWAAE